LQAIFPVFEWLILVLSKVFSVVFLAKLGYDIPIPKPLFQTICSSLKNVNGPTPTILRMMRPFLRIANKLDGRYFLEDLRILWGGFWMKKLPWNGSRLAMERHPSFRHQEIPSYKIKLRQDRNYIFSNFPLPSTVIEDLILPMQAGNASIFCKLPDSALDKFATSTLPTSVPKDRSPSTL